MRLPTHSGIAAALGAAGAALQQLPARGMLIGGLAVVARGLVRTTRDIDLAVEGGQVDPKTVLSVFESAGFEARVEDPIGFAARAQVLLLHHADTGIPLDLSFGWLRFELEALARAELIELAGVELPVAQAEDLIIYKAVAWRPVDRQDIEGLLLHHDNVDLVRVRRIVAELAEAIDEPERIAKLEELILRARG